jgi:hypothetical protein
MRARAAKDEAPIPIGAEALIVDRVADVFVAIPAPADIFNNSSSAEPS